MSKKIRARSKVTVWAEFEESIGERVPHLSAWLNDVDSFNELRLKARDDGTTLAIAKGYGEDGGPLVCFGVGYGVAATLMAIDATMQGGRWRVDVPWDGKRK